MEWTVDVCRCQHGFDWGIGWIGSGSKESKHFSTLWLRFRALTTSRVTIAGVSSFGGSQFFADTCKWCEQFLHDFQVTWGSNLWLVFSDCFTEKHFLFIWAVFKIPLSFHWILVGLVRDSPSLHYHNPQISPKYTAWKCKLSPEARDEWLQAIPCGDKFSSVSPPCRASMIITA